MLDRIVLKDLTIAVGRNIILENINWTVKAGEHLIITGNCGIGKTVLAGAIAQNHRIVSGKRKYPFLGENPTFEVRQAAISLISFMDTTMSVNRQHYYQQRFNAFDFDGHKTVRQYLEKTGFDIINNTKLLINLNIYDLLDLERIKLSNGQTRKLLLAKVLIGKPQILIIDNPYDGLDTNSRKVLNKLLDNLVLQTEITLILAGHHQNLPKCITHRLHINEDRTLKYAKLKLFNPIKSSSKINNNALIAIKNHFHNTIHKEYFTNIIKFENVNIKYGNKYILKNINWEVKQGDKYVVIGSNGSGKSTLLSLVYADNPQAYANSIYLFDNKRGEDNGIWEIKRRIGFSSPELHAYFNKNLSAKEVVITGFTDTFTAIVNPTNDQLYITELLFDYFELQSKMAIPFNNLSTGIQRMLLLMRALAKSPLVLLLDEPFQGMDENMISLSKHLIDNILTKKHTLIFISHFRDELPAIINKELAL